MVYTPTSWGSTTLITPVLFDNMETQYTEVLAHWTTQSFRIESGSTFVVEVSATEPEHAAGRIYFDSSTDDLSFYISDGTSWIKLNGVTV